MAAMKKGSLKSSLFLLLAAFIWGVAFVAQSVGMDYMGPFSFNGARFILGALVLLPLVATRRQKAMKEGKEGAPFGVTLRGGILCGIALGSAALFQQFGIMYTTVGKAGFITTLYIILVPIASIFLGKKASGKVWIGAALAAVGMYLLCMTETLKLSRGDLLVFICALIFTVHILVIDHFAEKVDGVELSCLQFLVAGVIGWTGAILFEHPVLSDFIAGIVPLAYAGIILWRGIYAADHRAEGSGSHSGIPDPEHGICILRSGRLRAPAPDTEPAGAIRMHTCICGSDSGTAAG